MRYALMAMAMTTALSGAAVAADTAPKLDYDMLVQYYFSQKPALAEQDLGIDYALYKDCKAVKHNTGGQDEFAKRKQQKEFADWAKALSADQKLPETVMVSMEAPFGEYDFDKGAFAFDPLQADTVFKVKPSRGKTVYDCRPVHAEWPAEFNVSFANADAINGIPMAEEDAAKVKTNIGRRVRMDMTVRIDGVQLDRLAEGKAAPALKTTVLEMNLVQLDRTGRAVGDLAHIDAAALAQMTEADSANADAKPMVANTESFALWADKLSNAGLAAQQGIDGSGVTLSAIALPVKMGGLSYKTEWGGVPGDIAEDGTVLAKPMWHKMGNYPKEIEVKTDMGWVVVKFDNQADFDDKKHVVNADFVKFLQGTKQGVSWQTELVVTPTAYAEEETTMGKRKVFNARIDRLVYTARPLGAKQTAEITLSNDTIVK